MQYAAIFPGQGSQRPGMGQDIFHSSEAARHVFGIVSDSLDSDIQRLCFETDEDTLRSTDNAQVALFTVGVATYEALREVGAGAPAATGSRRAR